MSVQLNILRRIASITGELAIYKDNNSLTLVRIERIIIDPDFLSFNLQALAGDRMDHEQLNDFTISAFFEYLDHSDGRYTSKMISWVLETDPIRVIYLRNMINAKVSFDQVSEAMNKPQPFYDEITIKVVTNLISLKIQIKNRKIKLTSNLKFKGQSWGGAGVMVISTDEETINQFFHFEGEIIISEHATQIGELFQRIRRIIAISPKYNHLSKLEFWCNLVEAANSVKSENGATSLDKVCEKIILMAIDFMMRDPLTH